MFEREWGGIERDRDGGGWCSDGLLAGCEFLSQSTNWSLSISPLCLLIHSHACAHTHIVHRLPKVNLWLLLWTATKRTVLLAFYTEDMEQQYR